MVTKVVYSSEWFVMSPFVWLKEWIRRHTASVVVPDHYQPVMVVVPKHHQT